MTPDIGSRLQALISSLSEVVIPAIDQNNATAIEQAQIISASLALISTQVDYLHPYELVNVSALIELSEKVCAVAKLSAGKEAEFAKEVLAKPLASTLELRQASNALRSQIVEIVASCEKDIAAKIQPLVFDYEEGQSLRDRVLVVGTGFDVEADSLPSMADVFCTAARK